MGWYINLKENSVDVSREAAILILMDKDCTISNILRKWDLEAEPEQFVDLLVRKDGKFRFYSRHLEHMDYVWEPSVLRALTESKAKGKITFSSSDGDNKGQVWSYVFDGLGGFEYFRNGISTELV